MENSSYNERLITKNKLVEHISVVFIFSILTVIFTFPVILDFGSQAAGEECGDKCHMMWRIWWTDFSFNNGLDFQHPDHIFYPNGVDIGGNLAYFTTFIGFLLVQFLDYTVTWNIIWFLGLVFGGYGCYLLANNFNKNYASSIIAGIIFTFTTYHMAHSMMHLGLTMIVWIPIFVLFLFKLLEKQSKYYPVIGGIIFFLVSLTHLYYFVLVALFAIVFFAVYIFRQKKVTNKTFITNFSILLTIGLISTGMLFLSNIETSSEFPDRPLFEHIAFSINLENLILPVPEHTTQILSDNGAIRTFYSIFDVGFDAYFLQMENLVFLGYAVIFLSTLAVVKYRQNHIWFWLLICGIFILISLGPQLKVFWELTEILLPERILFDTIPEWDELRAIARFILIANLSLAILASFAVYGLIKNRFSSFKQQIMLATVIGFVILFEFSMIPYPTHPLGATGEPINPEIYEEIKNDQSKFAVLPAPLGGVGEFYLMSDPVVLHHQMYHEKPIYGGFESRASYETVENIQSYFLNMFRILGGKDDVIKQDLDTHGLSLFNHFDIKYVVLHKEMLSFSGQNKQILNQIFLPETKQMMKEILDGDKPIYEDNKIIVYKIPKPNSSDPFLLLGSGWHLFEREHNARATMESSDIIIVNPTNLEMIVSLDLVASGIIEEQTMTVSMNDEILEVIDIPIIKTDVEIGKIVLKPGINTITLQTDEFTTLTYDGRNEYIKYSSVNIGFKIESISITN